MDKKNANNLEITVKYRQKAKNYLKMSNFDKKQRLTLIVKDSIYL